MRSVGVARSCHKLDGDVTPPAKRQLDPTTATGSETGFLYGILQSDDARLNWCKRRRTAVRREKNQLQNSRIGLIAVDVEVDQR